MARKGLFGLALLLCLALATLAFLVVDAAKPITTLLIPLDSRPCNTAEAQLLGLGANREVLVPQEGLDHFQDPGQPEVLWAWLEKEGPGADDLILFSNSLLNGGLIASRNPDSYKDRTLFVQRLEAYLRTHDHKRVTVVTVLPRDLASEHDPVLYPYTEALEAWGKAAYDSRTFARLPASGPDLPPEVTGRYTLLYQEAKALTESLSQLEEEGLVDAYLVALDDHSAKSLALLTAELVEQDRGQAVLHGGDELASMVLALPPRGPGHSLLSFFAKNKSLEVIYCHPKGQDAVADYESKSLRETVSDQAAFLGYQIRPQGDQALLICHQGADEDRLNKGLAKISPGTPWALADVTTTNQGDPFLENLATHPQPQMVVYSGWNTQANALGTSLAALKISGMVTAREGALAQYRTLRLVVDQAYLGHLAPKLLPSWRDQGLIDVCGVFASPSAQAQCTEDLNRAYQVLRAREPAYPDIHLSFPWPRSFEVAVEETPTL